jgi:hypothetical protein
MALELATEDPDYESLAIQTFTQFLTIANAVGGHVDGGVSLWDPERGFFKDLIIDPDGLNRSATLRALAESWHRHSANPVRIPLSLSAPQSRAPSRAPARNK